MDELILKAQELEKTYTTGAGDLQVLRRVNLSMKRGESLAVLGASGSGKSTLLHLLGLLDRPSAGRIEFEGRSTAGFSQAERSAYRNRSVGFVFQMFHLLPELTALQNVVLPQMVASSLTGWWGGEHAAHYARGRELLEAVGLADREDHKPRQLSGGECQRVAIARALFNRPPLLLCDEPTGNLDLATSREVVDLLFAIHAEQDQTLVMVTHNPELAARADRTVHLVNGRLKKTS